MDRAEGSSTSRDLPDTLLLFLFYEICSDLPQFSTTSSLSVFCYEGPRRVSPLLCAEEFLFPSFSGHKLALLIAKLG